MGERKNVFLLLYVCLLSTLPTSRLLRGVRHCTEYDRRPKGYAYTRARRIVVRVSREEATIVSGPHIEEKIETRGKIRWKARARAPQRPADARATRVCIIIRPGRDTQERKRERERQ